EGTVDAPAATGTVAFRDLRYDDYRIGSGSADLTLANQVAEIDATLPDFTASLEGTVGLDEPQPISAHLVVDRLELDRLADVMPAVADDSSPLSRLTGVVGLTAEVTGTVADIESAIIDANLALLDAAVDGIPVTLERPARVQYQAETVTADALALGIGTSSRIVLDGQLGEAAP